MVDLVYSPANPLLREAQAQGAVVLNGQDMLGCRPTRPGKFGSRRGLTLTLTVF